MLVQYAGTQVEETESGGPDCGTACTSLNCGKRGAQAASGESWVDAFLATVWQRQFEWWNWHTAAACKLDFLWQQAAHSEGTEWRWPDGRYNTVFDRRVARAQIS